MHQPSNVMQRPVGQSPAPTPQFGTIPTTPGTPAPPPIGQQQQQPQTPSKDQSLTLKVMRLCRPKLHIPFATTCEPSELFASSLQDNSVMSTRNMMGRDALLLPANFGSIYLGERFSSYISVCNKSSHRVTNIGLKAELQTTSQRFTLLDTTNQPVDRGSGECSDFIVEHELKEAGIHILICSATYLDNDGETKYFRKFFKFNVLNPLIVKTKVNSSDKYGDFLETLLQNGTEGPLFLQSVKFDGSPAYDVVDLNQVPAENGKTTTTFGDMTYMKPGDVRQHLYRLIPNENMLLQQKGNVLGKLEILWRTNMGEPGRLQTSPVQKKETVPKDVVMSLQNVPTHVSILNPFNAVCIVSNVSDKSYHLQFCVEQPDTPAGISVNGVSGQFLGEILPRTTASIPIGLFPIKPGLQKISGIHVVDIRNSTSFALEDPVEVFVMGDEDLQGADAGATGVDLLSM
eukprot:GFYU01012226.1.p1 GENE.GFYU01012226.1~~GFYU01012226.1.p1  ORF type:complete len:459 (+),score=100.52 GFYU01012226.1:88-1464(+)